MATNLVNVGEFLDTSTSGLLDDEIIPLSGGGYAIVQVKFITDPADPFNFSRETNLFMVGADGTPTGKTVKLGNINIDKAKALADGSLLISSKSDDETTISLGTVSKTGVIKTFYKASLSAIKTNDFFSPTESAVTFGKDNTIAVARIAEDKIGQYRAVDIVSAAGKLVASVAVDRNLATDQSVSTGLTALSDGRYLVTWSETTKKGSDVVGRIVTKDGKLSGAAFAVAHVDDLGTPADTHIRYGVTALANGGFALAFAGSEYDENPDTGQSASVSGKYSATIWTANQNGTFAKGPVLVQDPAVKSGYLVGFTALSDGRILELVSDTVSSSGGTSRTTLKGYLYGADGKYVGNALEFFSSTDSIFKSTEVSSLDALEGGRFALGLDFTGGNADTPGGHHGIQVYGLSTAGYAAVRGATAGDDVLKGNATTDLAESIDGLAGADKLYGFGGNDLLLGGAGNDRLDGGKGADRMEGGAGDDTYLVDNLGDFVIEGAGAGLDTVQASITHALADNVENLILTGTAAIDGIGNALANSLTGNDASNQLDGGAGADIMRGGAGSDTYWVDNQADQVFEAAKKGNDTVVTRVSYVLADDQAIEVLRANQFFGSTGGPINLTGNNLSNALIGDSGSNVLNGKGAADVLIGNFGNDTFMFDTALGGGNVDRIVDFGLGDSIRLENAVFKGLANGTLASTAFKDTAVAAVDKDDRILYDSKTGVLSYDADGSGAAKAVQFALLGEVGATTHPGLSSSDFFVV